MLKQGLNQKLLQKLSPQQIQYIQLLQLNVTELETRLEEELAENPALEMDDNPQESEDDFASDTLESEDKPEKEQEVEIDVTDYMTDDDGNDNYYYSKDDEERQDIPYAGTQTLFSLLDSQLNTTRLNDHKKTIAHHLIGMIEDDGYIRRPLKNIAFDLMFLNNIQTTEEELEEVLMVIQDFEPAGIAARNLEECLSIQIKKMPNDPRKNLALTIVNKYLKELGNKHYDKLLKALKIDTEELKDVIDLITHLNPKPGESQGSGKVQYVIPDFIVMYQDEELTISLNSKNAPELKVSRSYQDTLMGYQNSKVKNEGLKKQVQFIKQKLDGAKWFIEAVKQRQNTLLETMKTIVELQKEYFETGDKSKLSPMILKDVADRINMDISTVSRVASSKYVQTDFGIFSLKEFFSEGITTEDGTEVSNIEVKEKLKEIIDAEDKDKPLTDDQLTDMLKEVGYNIARRTVAKYREQLSIPVARLRREL